MGAPPKQDGLARSTSEPLPPGTRLDEKYVIVAHIKTGGMGAVYEVEHTGLGKRLAAKLLLPELVKRPELLERFHREARAASATGHENIVEVTDLGETRSGAPFLVMELLDGRTLGTELKEGRLPPERAVHITRQILSALRAAHARGIVHRDLKPENIFLIQRGGDPDFVKVLDFGIAKRLDEELGEELTQAGQVVGTPTYMAPEQARGGEIDHRVDVYASGALLYRMVTGHRPFVGPNFNALLFAIAQGAPTPPRQHAPEVSPVLEAAILRAMLVDPRARYQSVDAFDEALAEDERTVTKQVSMPRKPLPTSAPQPGVGAEWSQGSMTFGLTGSGTKVRRAVSGLVTGAIVLGLVVALAGGTWLVARRVLKLRAEAQLKAEAQAARARVLAAPQATFVHVTLRAEPPSAQLSLDGALVGAGAITLDLVKDGARHIARAEADGFLPDERAFLAAGDQTVTLKLKKGKSTSSSASSHRPKNVGPTNIDAPATDGDDGAQLKKLEKLLNKLGDDNSLGL